MEKSPSRFNKKKLRNWTIVVIIFGLLLWWISSSLKKNSQLNFDVPKGPIHWHPHLLITIDGTRQLIPPGIGLGSVHQPIHTHENNGTLHMENERPTKQTVTLGYFFKVWGKTFTKDCIFEYCSDKGSLTMYVNGKENFDFENYFMQDKDEIKIEYTSYKNGSI